MAGLNVVLWNSAGLTASAVSTALKTGFFDKQFPVHSFSVAAFVETHHKSELDFPEYIRQSAINHHVVHAPTPPGYTHGGIIVLINKEYDVLHSQIADPGRLLNIRLSHAATAHTYNITVYYGYVWARPGMTKAKMLQVLDLYRQVVPVQANNVIIGDFNFADLDIDKGKGMDTRDKTFTALWEEFKSELGLQDPYRVQHPDKRIFSYIASCGKSRGDRVYVNRESVPNVCRYSYDHVPFNSAHKIMSFKLQDRQAHGPGYWKLNASLLTDRSYTQLVENTARDVTQMLGNNHPDWWDLFLTCIRSETIPYSQRRHNIATKVRARLCEELQGLESIPLDELSKAQAERYTSLKETLRQHEEREINGHRARTRGIPKYEVREPNIAFFAQLEKRSVQRSVIGELRDTDGSLFSDNYNLRRITYDFYSALYTPTHVDTNVQDTLLRNIDRKLSDAQRVALDATITAKELETAVYQQHDEKSPGLDGITAEFYKKYWPLLAEHYLTFINHARQTSFPDSKNIAITALLYKERGDVDDLKNYRPISLMNVDLKILTKVLANRLKLVLPSIIHRSQTAVEGRRIDHTVHMLRDLIQLANNENVDAAFIFLDQEKAFDRVDHAFLFKTMRAFGIGDEFIQWVRLLYSNASACIKINGYLSAPISLRRGVRQGCPLSSLLYVMVIEILALQLRANPQYVGFTVGGEKIISLHYADDAIITIKQNCCFKEVIKDLDSYEMASGAKVNYTKTKGLWVGNWKGRLDSPMSITWTSANVKTLGVYFGNDDPGRATFAEIMPKIHHSMNYWKQFRLSKLAKARVIEIFHASRLWYAAQFYPLPAAMEKALQQRFFDYVNYPQKVTISQAEMQKLRAHGGAKLVNITVKSEASKIRWLMDLCTNPQLVTHLALVTRLLGVQKGGLSGVDLFFTSKHYARRTLKVTTPFYNVAIKAITALETAKRITDPRIEPLFYNPTFCSGGKILLPNKTAEDGGILNYGQLLDEVALRTAGQPYRRHITAYFDRMTTQLDNRQDWTLTLYTGPVPFQTVTAKILYAHLIRQLSKDHHSTERWVTRLRIPIIWDKVWDAIHNRLATEEVKSLLWEQLHLNMYTTYSYNKWHNSTNHCPFCLQTPDDRFHIILDCPMTHSLWNTIEPFLQRIVPTPVTDEEKAFGLLGNTPAICLRNWLTYTLRFCIHQQECIAYHNKLGIANARPLRHAYNAQVKAEAYQNSLIYDSLGRTDLFEKYFAVNGAFAVKDATDQWQIATIFS